MIREPKKRILEKLAYRYWVKNKKRSSEENWEKAEKLLLLYIEKRKSLIKRILK